MHRLSSKQDLYMWRVRIARKGAHMENTPQFREQVHLLRHHQYRRTATLLQLLGTQLRYPCIHRLLVLVTCLCSCRAPRSLCSSRCSSSGSRCRLVLLCMPDQLDVRIVALCSRCSSGGGARWRFGSVCMATGLVALCGRIACFGTSFLWSFLQQRIAF